MALQGTLLIFDIGYNTSGGNGDKSFFESSKKCITRIIERKIMALTNDLIGIILMGSNSTKEYSSSINNVELLSDLELPSWKMIRSLPDEPTKNSSDWFEALVFSATHFTNKNLKELKKRIILFTNFMTPTDVCQIAIEKGLNELIKENIQVDVIGYNINSETVVNTDIKLIKKVIEITNGVTDTFDQAMKEFLFYNKKYATGSTWKVGLHIGKIEIPISSYLRVKTITNNDILKEWKLVIRDPITGKASDSYAVGKKKTLYFDEDNRLLSHERVTEGWHYGQEIVPISALDNSLIYKSGPMSLRVYGFTSASNIKWENLNHNTLSYVHGRNGCKNANYAIKCLAQCLIDEKLVGIARGVKRATSAPRMYVLMPVKEEEFICLSMVGICYKEEIKHITFPETESKKFVCSNEQVNAFKNLIKDMDLNGDNFEFDDNETFNIGEVPCPTVQHIYDSIVYRAKNPGEPVPGPRSDIMKLFQVPSVIKNNVENSLEKLKSLFVLNAITKRKNNVSASSSDALEVDNIADYDKVEDNVSNICNIGTLNPIGDYKFCLNSGKPLNIVMQEMTDAIETLMFNSLDEHCTKALEAMLFFRMEGVKSDPSFYNNWLKKFKTELVCRGKNDITNLIKNKNIDYILNDENKLSKLINSDVSDLTQDYYFEHIKIDSEAENIFDEM